MDSQTDGSYTYSLDKYSCVRGAYYAHITFNYLVMFAGFACFFSRMAPPSKKWLHRWFGRAYIIFMIWSIATSLLIHNTGLPLAVLWSFIWVLAGMCIGWIVIVFHMQKMEKLATTKVAEEIQKTGDFSDLLGQIQKAKGKIAEAKTFKQRLFSLKALHGALMFTSWINIIGRIFVTPITGDFTCHTYPAYKNIDTKHGFYANSTVNVLVEPFDPNYSRMPWAKMGVPAWAVALSIGPLAGAFLIGAIVSYFAANKKYKSGSDKESDDGSGGSKNSPIGDLAN